MRRRIRSRQGKCQENVCQIGKMALFNIQPGAHGNGRNASTVMVRPGKFDERPTSFLPSFPPIICHHLPRRGGMNEAGAPPIWVACSQCKQAEGMAWLNLPGTCIRGNCIVPEDRPDAGRELQEGVAGREHQSAEPQTSEELAKVSRPRKTFVPPGSSKALPYFPPKSHPLLATCNLQATPSPFGART